MAYEKLLNEIYAAVSLEYLWPEYRPCFVKNESPDWINETMDLGLEVSQALLLDDGYPFGTCRMFAAGDGMAEIGRVVVLEQYRGKGYGSLLLCEAERWLQELGFSRACVESRDVAVGFYEKLGYRVMGQLTAGDTFSCVHMEKELHDHNGGAIE